jgi:hypothetical protein
MSNMARTDEIDKVVSSVRDFVSHKDQQKTGGSERLVLQPDQRISAEAAVTETAVRALMSDQTVADNVLVLEGDQPAGRAGLEATIAELEAAVTAQSDDWEADEGEDFAQAAWATSAFEIPAAKTAAPAPAYFEVPQAPPSQSEGGSDAADRLEASVMKSITADMDVETLRALVVAMIHEELGGEMGERMTRNVRKLVRREINRVLARHGLGEDQE